MKNRSDGVMFSLSSGVNMIYTSRFSIYSVEVLRRGQHVSKIVETKDNKHVCLSHRTSIVFWCQKRYSIDIYSNICYRSSLSFILLTWSSPNDMKPTRTSILIYESLMHTVRSLHAETLFQESEKTLAHCLLLNIACINSSIFFDLLSLILLHCIPLVKYLPLIDILDWIDWLPFDHDYHYISHSLVQYFPE